MLRVVESFSGIGSQNRALENIKNKSNVEYEILNTIEWDINAIFAYDLIHNGIQKNNPYENYSKEELIKKISSYTLSLDGKNPINISQLVKFNDNTLKTLLYAIKRTKNLASIKDVKGKDLPEDIDLLTYSFPCQDLSLSGYFHGDQGGIKRDAQNSSSLLWEIERILFELKKQMRGMPKFLLMENVASITSSRHIENFNDWISSLEELGYSNKYGHLCAENFGIPQKRKRTFMISVYHGNDPKSKEKVDELLNKTIRFDSYNDKINNTKLLSKFLKLDYSIEKYKLEAKINVPNDTKSRRKIYQENPIIVSNNKIKVNYVRTLTTKQDRHPNSGNIEIDKKELGLEKGKSNYRFLTPRETMLLMGFNEKDYEVLIDNNINITKHRKMLNKEKIYKLAGNSIVVNVIEEVFSRIIEMKNELY